MRLPQDAVLVCFYAATHDETHTEVAVAVSVDGIGIGLAHILLLPTETLSSPTANIVSLCENCGELEENHAQGACLFQSTRWQVREVPLHWGRDRDLRKNRYAR